MYVRKKTFINIEQNNGKQLKCGLALTETNDIITKFS